MSISSVVQLRTSPLNSGFPTKPNFSNPARASEIHALGSIQPINAISFSLAGSCHMCGVRHCCCGGGLDIDYVVQSFQMLHTRCCQTFASNLSNLHACGKLRHCHPRRSVTTASIFNHVATFSAVHEHTPEVKGRNISRRSALVELHNPFLGLTLDHRPG